MPHRQHRRLVKYLVVIASVLTVFAIFSVWVQRQLLSTNEWVHTSGKLLENKPIQEALGTYAVSEFYGAVNVSRAMKASRPSLRSATVVYPPPVALTKMRSTVSSVRSRI